jgi:hypothetical protein
LFTLALETFKRVATSIDLTGTCSNDRSNMASR